MKMLQNKTLFQKFKTSFLSKSVLLLVFFLTTNLELNAQQPSEEEQAIEAMLLSWHKAAADADFEAYFTLMTDDAVFIGTDATENWTVSEFKSYSKPYFDNGKAWSFTTLERSIFIDPEYPNVGWFDELLDTQMGICRGSGVIKKKDSQWKVQHYVLSIAVPNEFVSQLTKMKKDWDQSQIKEIRKKM